MNIKEMRKGNEDSIAYHTSSSEIDANWEAFSHISKKYKDVKDSEFLSQLYAIKGFFIQHDPYYYK